MQVHSLSWAFTNSPETSPSERCCALLSLRKPKLREGKVPHQGHTAEPRGELRRTCLPPQWGPHGVLPWSLLQYHAAWGGTPAHKWPQAHEQPRHPFNRPSCVVRASAQPGGRAVVAWLAGHHPQGVPASAQAVGYRTEAQSCPQQALCLEEAKTREGTHRDMGQMSQKEHTPGSSHCGSAGYKPNK